VCPYETGQAEVRPYGHAMILLRDQLRTSGAEGIVGRGRGIAHHEFALQQRHSGRVILEAFEYRRRTDPPVQIGQVLDGLPQRIFSIVEAHEIESPSFMVGNPSHRSVTSDQVGVGCQNPTVTDKALKDEHEEGVQPEPEDVGARMHWSTTFLSPQTCWGGGRVERAQEPRY
jgi:hypothetical protein